MGEDVRTYAMRPIGSCAARTARRSTSRAARARSTTPRACSSCWPEFEAGLTDIEGFSHLYVLWVFDRAEGFELVPVVPADDRPHGVFASRSPRGGPTRSALTVVELLGRDGPRLRVRGVDMLDGTPVLDIKPYLSSVPPEKLRRGWLAEAEERKKRGPA